MTPFRQSLLAMAGASALLTVAADPLSGARGADAPAPAPATKVGQRLDNLAIHASDDMARVIGATGAELGVLTVPSQSCQAVADALIAAGIRGLLNFAPAVLRVPPGVSVVSVDLTVQLEQLAFLVQLSSHE